MGYGGGEEFFSLSIVLLLYLKIGFQKRTTNKNKNWQWNDLRCGFCRRRQKTFGHSSLFLCLRVLHWSPGDQKYFKVVFIWYVCVSGFDSSSMPTIFQPNSPKISLSRITFWRCRSNFLFRSMLVSGFKPQRLLSVVSLLSSGPFVERNGHI